MAVRKVVTTAALRRAGACEDGVRSFERVFPGGVAEITPENVRKARSSRLNIHWLLIRLPGVTPQEVFEKKFGERPSDECEACQRGINVNTTEHARMWEAQLEAQRKWDRRFDRLANTPEMVAFRLAGRRKLPA